MRSILRVQFLNELHVVCRTYTRCWSIAEKKYDIALNTGVFEMKISLTGNRMAMFNKILPLTEIGINH